MSVSREQAIEALLDLLSQATDFKFKSRRFQLPSSLSSTEQPALFVCEPDEDHSKGKQATPAIRMLNVEAWIYISSGLDRNVIPATDINNILDAIDPVSGGVLSPNDFRGKQTLGGLVTDCYIEGKITKIPGDLDGQGVLRIPIKIVFMQP